MTTQRAKDGRNLSTHPPCAGAPVPAPRSLVFLGGKWARADASGNYTVSVEGRGVVHVSPDFGGAPRSLLLDPRRRDRVLDFSHNEGMFGETTFPKTSGKANIAPRPGH